MLRLFELMFYGHCHKWRRIAQGPFERHLDGEVVRRGTAFTCQCENCGRIKTFYSY